MVFETAKQLGEALHESEAYQNLMAAQAALQADQQAFAIMTGINALEDDIRALMEQPEQDEDAMREKMTLYRQLREQAGQNEVISTYQKANQAFQGIMDQVNKIITFHLTGSTGDESCSGSCSTCAGCAHHH